MIARNCIICNKEFKVFPYTIKNGNGFYCSSKCQFESMRKTLLLTCKYCNKKFKSIPADKAKYCSQSCAKKALIGIPRSKETRLKISVNLTGKKSYIWKGDNVGYMALHEWVRKQLGTPSVCVGCGNTKAKRYEWSNISQEYKRDILDWERLCLSCHKKKDTEYRNTYLNGFRIKDSIGRFKS